MKNIFWAIAGTALIVVIIILSGKNQTNSTAPTDDGNDGMVTNGPMIALTSSVWVWEKTEYTDGSEMKPNHPKAFTVKFKSDGTVSGTTDCNSWSSTFTLGALGEIRLSPIVSTLMFCENSQETPYLSGFEGVDKLTFSPDGLLRLDINIDNVGTVATMIFSPADEPAEVSDWVSTTSDGKSFSYPAELGTNYISLTQWPPILQIKNEMYSCVSAGAEIENAGATTEETVNGHKYCVTRISEGAAGSMYTEYFYARPAGTKTEVMTFTLRFVQCGNYNDPEKTKCELERNTFDVGDTVDRIFQTVK